MMGNMVYTIMNIWNPFFWFRKIFAGRKNEEELAAEYLDSLTDDQKKAAGLV